MLAALGGPGLLGLARSYRGGVRNEDRCRRHGRRSRARASWWPARWPRRASAGRTSSWWASRTWCAAELAKHGDMSGLPIEVVHASEVVEMEEHTMAVKAKKDSSMMVGMRLVKEGRAEAFASAGNSGAVMAAALFGLGPDQGRGAAGARQHLSGVARAVPHRRHRRECGLQARVPRPVCADGQRVRPADVRPQPAQGRHHLQRRGGRQGQHARPRDLSPAARPAG